MRLVQIFLPRADGRGRRVARAEFEAVAKELTQEFGGVTAYLHSPALGLWKANRTTHRDEVVVFEIMVGRINHRSWQIRRRQLETRFRQQEIVIRALPYERL